MDPNLIAIYLVVALRSNMITLFENWFISAWFDKWFWKYAIWSISHCDTARMFIGFSFVLVARYFWTFYYLRVFFSHHRLWHYSKVSFAGLLLSSQVTKLATVLFNESNQKKKKNNEHLLRMGVRMSSSSKKKTDAGARPKK